MLLGEGRAEAQQRSEGDEDIDPRRSPAGGDWAARVTERGSRHNRKCHCADGADGQRVVDRGLWQPPRGDRSSMRRP